MTHHPQGWEEQITLPRPWPRQAGGEIQVNSYTTNTQRHSATAVLDNQGNFAAVWDSVGSFGNDNREESVQAQRFLGVLFADGFESGDTSAWSSSVP